MDAYHLVPIGTGMSANRVRSYLEFAANLNRDLKIEFSNDVTDITSATATNRVHRKLSSSAFVDRVPRNPERPDRSFNALYPFGR